MDCSGGDDPNARVALINPVVLRVEGDQTGDEGCLSFPGIFFPVKRSLRAVVRAQDVNGEEFEYDGLELEARCMLHETDHCDGIVFIDHTTPLAEYIVSNMSPTSRLSWSSNSVTCSPGCSSTGSPYFTIFRSAILKNSTT